MPAWLSVGIADRWAVTDSEVIGVLVGWWFFVFYTTTLIRSRSERPPSSPVKVRVEHLIPRDDIKLTRLSAEGEPDGREQWEDFLRFIERGTETPSRPGRRSGE